MFRDFVVSYFGIMIVGFLLRFGWLAADKFLLWVSRFIFCLWKKS